MNFIVGLPRTRTQNDSIWVVMDRLKKSAHFIPVKSTNLTEYYVRIYIDEMVSLHGIPLSIILNRGAKFTSHFWRTFKKGLGTQVKLSTAYHPQMDGKADCIIQTLEEMLRSCAIDFKGNWYNHLPLIEFSYNNSYSLSVSIVPFEELYGRRCRSPVWWFEVGESSLLYPDIIYDALEKVWVITDRLKTSYSRQKSYVDNRRRELEFERGYIVCFKFSPMKEVMTFGKKGKLSPWYMGHYEVVQRVGKVAYVLRQPSELALVHPVFHVSMIKKGIDDPVSILPTEDLVVDESIS